MCAILLMVWSYHLTLPPVKKPDPCVNSSNKIVVKTVLPKIRMNMMSSCDIFSFPLVGCPLR